MIRMSLRPAPPSVHRHHSYDAGGVSMAAAEADADASAAAGTTGAGFKVGSLLMRHFTVDQGVSPFDLQWVVSEGATTLSASLMVRRMRCCARGARVRGSALSCGSPSLPTLVSHCPDVRWPQYNTALFKGDTMARLGDHIVTLLSHAMAEPTTPIGALRMMTPAESKLVLVDWNQTALPHRTDVCAHTLFEERVAQQPTATAIVCDGAVLTYAALNERANTLAW